MSNQYLIIIIVLLITTIYQYIQITKIKEEADKEYEIKLSVIREKAKLEYENYKLREEIRISNGNPRLLSDRFHKYESKDLNCILTKKVKLGKVDKENLYSDNSDVYSVKVYNDGNIKFKKPNVNIVNVKLSKYDHNHILDLKRKLTISPPRSSNDGDPNLSVWYILHNMKTENGKNVDYVVCSSGSCEIPAINSINEIDKTLDKILDCNRYNTKI
jgi:hypothetical protein